MTFHPWFFSMIPPLGQETIRVFWDLSSLRQHNLQHSMLMRLLKIWQLFSLYKIPIFFRYFLSEKAVEYLARCTCYKDSTLFVTITCPKGILTTSLTAKFPSLLVNRAETDIFDSRKMPHFARLHRTHRHGKCFTGCCGACL